MIRLHFSVTTLHDPLCPVCNAPLLANLWYIRGQIAYCPLCADTPNPRYALARARVRAHYRLNRSPADWYTTNGLHFYTPLTPNTHIALALQPLPVDVGDVLIDDTALP